jgi:serine protease Do
MFMPFCVRRIFLAIASCLLLGASFAVAQTEQPAQSSTPAKLLVHNDPLHIFSQSVQELSSQVSKSVVQIQTVGYGLTSENSDKTDTSTAYLTPQRGIGAGVVMTPDGYIVTNAHVVEGARKIRVRLQGMNQGSDATDVRGPAEAKLVGVDHLSDVALIKIDAANLPALQFADSGSLKQGQVVFAFGSPLGLENSVTMGVVSATERQIDPDNPAIYIPATAEVLWSTSMERWLASTPSSCPNRAATRAWDSRSPAMW